MVIFLQKGCMQKCRHHSGKAASGKLVWMHLTNPDGKPFSSKKNQKFYFHFHFLNAVSIVYFIKATCVLTSGSCGRPCFLEETDLSFLRSWLSWRLMRMISHSKSTSYNTYHDFIKHELEETLHEMKWIWLHFRIPVALNEFISWKYNFLSS